MKISKWIIILAVLLAALFLVLAGGWYWLQTANKGISFDKLQQTYMSSKDRLLLVDGVQVRVREQGDKAAPALVLLHGFTSSLESWDAVAGKLSADYHVLSYDLLGHGLTGPDPKMRYNPIERAQFLPKLLDKLDLDIVSVAGNSLGGTIAWRFAAEHPDRVHKLILLDAPAFAFNAVTDTPVKPPANIVAYLKYAPMAGLQQAASFTWADPEKVGAQRLKVMQDMMKRAGNGDAFVAHIEEFTMPDPTSDLAKIEAPTLILWGAMDIMIPLANAKKSMEVLAGAQLEVIENAGHMPQEEAPDTTAALMAAFLKE